MKDIYTTAFPITKDHAEAGMSLRDWFATFAPEPSDEDIRRESGKDSVNQIESKNRSRLMIVADLKFAYADAMMERRQR